MSALSFLGLGAWFAVHAPQPASTTAAPAGSDQATKASANASTTDLDDEISSAAEGVRQSSTTAATADTTSRGS